jgi:hypothetical protein
MLPNACSYMLKNEKIKDHNYASLKAEVDFDSFANMLSQLVPHSYYLD